jgi:nitrate/nitrite-specific signal transduction histidine kinase
MGIDIMHDRAWKIDAELVIESQPGSGTEIMVTWPGREKPTK